MKLPADENDIGLTKREYFAGLAMNMFILQGELARQVQVNLNERLKEPQEAAMATVARFSAEMADALIAELAK